MNQFEVSVIIPTYNRTRFIQEAIQSVLDQTVAALEILIVDDGSAVPYRQELIKIKDISPSIRLISLKKNTGVSHARNVGVNHALGGFVLFLDDDDLLHPNMISECVSIFKAKANTDVVLTGGMLLNQNLGILFHREKFVSINSMLLVNLLHRHNHSAVYFILYGMSLIHSFMFKREILLKFPFDEELEIAEDTYQWMLLKKNGVKFRKIRMSGALYRLHQDQVSLTNINESKSRMYLSKSMKLLSSKFEKSLFIQMNQHKLDTLNMNYKSPVVSNALAKILTKIFMITNRVERGWLLVKWRLNIK